MKLVGLILKVAVVAAVVLNIYWSIKLMQKGDRIEERLGELEMNTSDIARSELEHLVESLEQKMLSVECALDHSRHRMDLLDNNLPEQDIQAAPSCGQILQFSYFSSGF